MFSSTVPLAVAMTILLFDDAREAQIKKDVEALRGVWIVVKIEEGGRDVTREFGSATPFKLRIMGNKLIPIDKEQARESMAYTIDPTTKPKSMDLVVEDKTTTRMIYSLEGGQLKVALWFVIFGKQPEGRPTSFDTKTHKRLFCVVLKKAEK